MNIYTKNCANLVVLIRIVLIILAIYFLYIENFVYRIAGLATIIVAILLDYLDGYLARKLNIASRVGASLDMLGDRITENVLIIFFAYMRILPLGLAIYFVTRAFFADFIRSLNFNSGRGVYDVNISQLGYAFVASPLSRFLYLFLKTALFVEGGLILILSIDPTSSSVSMHQILNQLIHYTMYAVLIFNIIRFIYLIYDSRSTLYQYFC